MLLHEVFAETARRWPNNCALVCEGRRLSFEDIERSSNSLATVLQRSGVRRGDRVATLLDNGVEAVTTLLATSKAGGVHVPISALTKSEKLSFLLRDARVRMLVTHRGLAEVAAPAVRQADSLAGVLMAGGPDPSLPDALELETACSGSATPTPTECIDQDLAAIVYTSGSTGVPKGVMLTHGNLVSATHSICGYLKPRSNDVIMCVLPVAFNYGLSQLLVSFGSGATVILERSFAFPAKVIETIRREHATMFAGVPTVFAVLLGIEQEAAKLPSLRTITNAGAALSEPHVRLLRQRYPGADLHLMYGQTECVRVTSLDPVEADRRPTSVGRGMPNQELWLIDDDGRRLPDGSIGELVVRGSHVMAGYWERPEETAKRLKPGSFGERVLHTGDLFRSDSQGYLYFVARKDDIIKSRGEKVSPREVESALYGLEGVLEAAVIGVPDPLLGQAVKAFIALRPGYTYTERQVIRHCLAHLESYMAPKTVAFVDALPKTDNGKIRKTGLL